MKISIVETGKFKLDGGAMFGVVPKTMWSKLNEPDENNMCTWVMRCLLIEKGDRKILIDTGLGDKQDEKFRSHFHPHGSDSLSKSLNALGVSFEDITDVFLTHLHFDHAGGAVIRSGDHLIPTFPNAMYYTNDYHYQWAYEPNPRERASFLKENFVPLKEAGCLQFLPVEQDLKFNDFIQIRFVYGHTGAMMVPFIDLGNNKTLVYCADLLPSHCHVGMPYVMGYDVQPLETLKEKQVLYDQVTNDDHYLFMEHDKDYKVIQVTKNERGRFKATQKECWEDVVSQTDMK
jgi:glyoxylase-like metal-dependent hydrolase (beta-lactamase superfamily II)